MPSTVCTVRTSNVCGVASPAIGPVKTRPWGDVDTYSGSDDCHNAVVDFKDIAAAVRIIQRNIERHCTGACGGTSGDTESTKATYVNADLYGPSGDCTPDRDVDFLDIAIAVGGFADPGSIPCAFASPPPSGMPVLPPGSIRYDCRDLMTL